MWSGQKIFKVSTALLSGINATCYEAASDQADATLLVFHPLVNSFTAHFDAFIAIARNCSALKYFEQEPVMEQKAK